MKQLFIVISLLFSFYISAQELQFQEHGNRTAFLCEEQSLTSKELRQLLKTHEASWVAYRKIQRKTQLGLLIAVPGTALAGVELSRWSSGGTPNWTAVGFGVLGTGVGVFLNKNRKKRLRKVVRDFNEKTQTSDSIQ